MLNRFKRFLIPKFLQRLDDYLLESYPVVWRTQVHFVLFYALLATVLLFAAGFFTPVSAVNLQVKPIMSIEMVEDGQYHLGLFCVFILCSFWAYTQYKSGFPVKKIKEAISTLLIYAFSFWVLLGCMAPAYRVGTLYKTAWHWMEEDDLEAFEASGIYPFGFVLLGSGTIFSPQTDSFYNKRASLFREICKQEDTLLSMQYSIDTSFWNRFIDRSYRSGRSYRSYRSDRSDLSDLSDLSDRSDRSEFNQRKNNELKVLSGKYNLQKYGFRNGLDSITIDSMLITRPQLPYSMEDAVRSVKHARRYIREGIFWRYFFNLLYFLPFISLSFYFIPFLSLRNLLIAIFIVGFCFIYGINQSENISLVISYLLVPLIAIFCLFLLFAFKKKHSVYLLLSNVLFCVMFWGFVILFFDWFSVGAQKYPTTEQFFSMQILGLISAFRDCSLKCVY